MGESSSLVRATQHKVHGLSELIRSNGVERPPTLGRCNGARAHG